MHNRNLILVLVNFALLFHISTQSQGQIKMIKAGYLFDSESGKFIKDQLIIIEDGRITSVEKKSASATAEEIIDLSDSWVMPGFMDLHVHL